MKLWIFSSHRTEYLYLNCLLILQKDFFFYFFAFLKHFSSVSTKCAQGKFKGRKDPGTAWNINFNTWYYYIRILQTRNQFCWCQQKFQEVMSLLNCFCGSLKVWKFKIKTISGFQNISLSFFFLLWFLVYKFWLPLF